MCNNSYAFAVRSDNAAHVKRSNSLQALLASFHKGAIVRLQNAFAVLLWDAYKETGTACVFVFVWTRTCWSLSGLINSTCLQFATSTDDFKFKYTFYKHKVVLLLFLINTGILFIIFVTAEKDYKIQSEQG